MSAQHDGEDAFAAPAASDISDATVVRHSPAVVTVDLNGEAVLYDERSGMLHALNRTANAVWERLDGSASVAEVARALAAEADAAPAIVARDVLRVVRRMSELGLLRTAGKGATGHTPPRGADGRG